MRIASRTAAIWPGMLLLPLLVALLVQIPLCRNKTVSTFFENLSQIHALWLLSAVFILPSYGLLLWHFKTCRQRLIHGAILTLALVALLPLVWIFGFWSSRLLFTACLS